jgi:hypothetical protein
MTDNTYRSIRLNSSKQHHEPELANPLKNFLMAIKLRPSEQLKTTQGDAKALAKSLTV